MKNYFDICLDTCIGNTVSISVSNLQANMYRCRIDLLKSIVYRSGSQPFWRHYPNQGSEYALLPLIFHFVKEHNRAF